jgi:pyruvate dehydrogenase E1 component alpha subunit
LKKNKWIDDIGIDAMEAKIKTIVEESIAFAEESPYPAVEELYNDVYVQTDYPFIKE